MESKHKRNTILIVDDDSQIRMTLKELFVENYKILECENGLDGLTVLKQHQNSIVLVLLDIHMPVLSGYEVLEEMKAMQALNHIPVVLVTADHENSALDHGYQLGAVDVIWKPLQIETTKRRAKNIIEFYRHKNDLEELVELQTEKLMKQNEKYKKRNDIMMNILKEVITNRSIESEKHIQYVEAYSEIIANTYRKLYPRSKMTTAKIDRIKKSAKLHDLGKITMPEPLIKKKGRMLPAELEYLKEHTIRGGEIVMSMSEIQESAFNKILYNVCVYHHERFDGNGYPKGLKGEQIPIEAQIVATADMLDALANVATNKELIPIDNAIAMLLDGACGELSPRMKECVEVAREELLHCVI